MSSRRNMARRPCTAPDDRARVTGCRWIDGDPRIPGWAWCDAPTLPGKSWCATHAAIVFQQPEPQETDQR